MKLEYIFPIISTTFWGISIVGAKIVGDVGISPIEITFGRFFLASIIFVPILIYLSRKRDGIIPQGKSTWLMIFGLSLTGVAVNNTVFYFGLERTQAGIASLIVSLNPLMTMIFAVIMLGEQFTRKKGYSIILGIIGVALIIGFSGNTGQITGNLLILLGITIWGASFSFSRKASDAGMSSIAITGWSEIMGTLFLMPSVIINKSVTKLHLIHGEILFWFIFMGILSSVIAYIIHYQAISVLGASTVAPSTNIIPLSGAITSYLLLGEQFQGSPIIGSLFIITGVIIVQIENRRLSREQVLESTDRPSNTLLS